jgi:hypothetical protein
MMKGMEVETGRSTVTRWDFGKNMEGCSITLARVERLLNRMNGTEVENIGQNMQDSRTTLYNFKALQN